mgnify:CR=1 FL=1
MFDPETITIPANRPIQLNIANHDTYAHGLFIADIKINAWIPADEKTVIEIPALQPGTYLMSCSVICGEGHYRMSGKLVVTD